MALLKSERMEWSLEKQARLQEHLIDQWASDTWDVMERRPGSSKCYLHFSILSSGLNMFAPTCLHSCPTVWSIGRPRCVPI